MEIVSVLPTDAGMHALWDVAAFGSIDGYEAWSRELEDDADIRRHISAGHFVPIYIGSDGAFCIAVRADRHSMPALSADEKRRVIVRSEAYRLRSSGRIAVSGIEYVGPVDDTGGRRWVAGGWVALGQLEPGDYGVFVHLMDYDDVSDRTDAHPDFVVTVGPLTVDPVRTAVRTFEAR